METVHFMKDRPLSEARDLIKYFASYFLVTENIFVRLRDTLMILSNDFFEFLVSKNENLVGSICVFL